MRATAAKTRTHEAGVWEQGRGLVVWSAHRSAAAAERAAVRYARQSTAQSGGALSWAGCVREVATGAVRWLDRDGAEVRS